MYVLQFQGKYEVLSLKIDIINALTLINFTLKVFFMAN
jgi:hypothetical protein